MEEKGSRASDRFSSMGIPLAGGTGDPDGPDDATDDGDTELDPLDVEGVVGDVVDGLGVIRHSVYETPDGAGLGLLIENTGTRAFGRVEARIRLDDGSTAGEFVATSEAAESRLAPGDRWRLWIPLESGVSDTGSGYTVDLEGT